jgi:hypothetical protein
MSFEGGVLSLKATRMRSQMGVHVPPYDASYPGREARGIGPLGGGG